MPEKRADAASMTAEPESKAEYQKKKPKQRQSSEQRQRLPLLQEPAKAVMR